MVHELMNDSVVAHDRHTYTVGVQEAGWNTAISNIVFPGPGQMRSRKVVSRSSARPKGKYPSWKMSRMLEWESENELNAFRLLDCDPDVTRFCEQPCEVVYVLDGKARSHYPDILVEKDGQRELWEVKPESEAEEPEVVTRTTLLVQGLPFWGYTYRVVLANHLAMQPRQSNACFLLGFGRRAVTECEQEFIRRVFTRRGSLLWSDACLGEFGPWGREILCNLVLRGILIIDLNSPIGPSTGFVARKEGF
ncbi:MAG: TnsA endonuclease N-terminal domain-containing protein [Terracidiphilus sp.]|jgi:hypothetical protein